MERENSKILKVVIPILIVILIAIICFFIFRSDKDNKPVDEIQNLLDVEGNVEKDKNLEDESDSKTNQENSSEKDSSEKNTNDSKNEDESIIDNNFANRPNYIINGSNGASNSNNNHNSNSNNNNNNNNNGYVKPTATYTVDGVENVKQASTKITLAGDYAQVEYAISTSNKPEEVTNWINYVEGTEINIPNDQGTVYVITRMKNKQNGKYVYAVSKEYKMQPWEEPTAIYTVNGIENAKKVSTKIVLSGDYTKVEYVISTSNTPEEAAAWRDYEKDTEICLPNDQGTVYIITRMEKENDGSYVYFVSEAYKMLPWEEPTAEYTVDGIENVKQASTKISLTGDYSTVEYAIVTSNKPEDVTDWIAYVEDTEISIPNDKGTVYVITRLEKQEDSTYVYAVSKEYKMLPWELPEISYSIGSCEKQKIVDVTLSVTGDYSTIEYAIATSKNHEDVTNWIAYKENDIITVDQEGTNYILVRVKALANNEYVYKVSGEYNIVKYIDPTAEYTVDGAQDAKRISTKIILTGDYTKVEYAITTSNKPEDVTNWIEYVEDTEITISNDQKTVYVITRITKEEDGSYVYLVSKEFNMIPWVDPKVEFTVISGDVESIEHTTSLILSGDYSNVFYAIVDGLGDIETRADWIPYTEGETIKISDPYGISKYVAVKIQNERNDEYSYVYSGKFKLMPLVKAVRIATKYKNSLDPTTGSKIRITEYTIDVVHNIPSNAISVTYEFWTNDELIEHKSGSLDLSTNQIVINMGTVSTTNVTTKYIKFMITYDDGSSSVVTLTE